MKSMALLPTTALVALLAAASSGQAQNPPRSDPRSAPTEKSESTSEAIRRAGDAAKAAIGMNNSITGCLKQGDESDPYVLLDNDTGKSVTVVGLGDLAEHIDHTVKLKGNWKAGGEVYQATGIELVALSCEAPPSAGQKGGSGWLNARRDRGHQTRPAGRCLGVQRTAAAPPRPRSDPGERFSWRRSQGHR